VNTVRRSRKNEKRRWAGRATIHADSRSVRAAWWADLDPESSHASHTLSCVDSTHDDRDCRHRLRLFAVREMFFANTVYSAGYDERCFRQVRVGMTSAEVEALLGPPLKKVPWPQAGVVIWLYTDKRFKRGDYWRRDVFMTNDGVSEVMSTYWID
jgi:hypothetical protein